MDWISLGAPDVVPRFRLVELFIHTLSGNFSIGFKLSTNVEQSIGKTNHPFIIAV
jgi:hypothetical protein